MERHVRRTNARFASLNQGFKSLTCKTACCWAALLAAALVSTSAVAQTVNQRYILSSNHGLVQSHTQTHIQTQRFGVVHSSTQYPYATPYTQRAYSTYDPRGVRVNNQVPVRIGAEVQTKDVRVRTQVETGGWGRWEPYPPRYPAQHYPYTEKRYLGVKEAQRANQSQGWGKRYCMNQGQYGWHSSCDE